MLEEIRIGSLGVIESSTLELGPGLTVITGETGAGKTMIVTALGLLLGGRADSGAVRSGARRPRGSRASSASATCASFAAAVEGAGGEVEDDRVVLARNVSAEGRSRAFVGGASVPVSALAGMAEPLVAVHGQSDQHRLLQAARPARRAGPVRRRGHRRAARDLHRPVPAPRRHRAGARRGRGHRPRPRPRGRPAAVRARRDRGGLPGARRGRHAGGRGVAARVRRHVARRRRAGPRGAVQRAGRSPDALATTAAARTPARRRPRPRPGGRRAGRPAGGDHLPAVRRRGRRRVVRLPAWRPTRTAWPPSPSGGRRSPR